MPRAGERLGRYRLDAVLGQGAMGQVWSAEDLELGRRVAVKVVLPEPGVEASAFAQRVKREARAAARLNHPNAVAVYDVGEHEGVPFVVMELVDGKTLRAAALDTGTTIATKVGWLVDAARALGAAHKEGIVHRDVKPDNVMIRADGTAKVLDFGIARGTEAPIDPSAPTEQGGLGTLTQPGIIVGTPLYMPPEQLRREPLDGRADQYAWGMTAYEVLAGAPPWSPSDAVAAIAAGLAQRPDDLGSKVPSLDPAVASAVMRTLEKRREDRFVTMEDLVATLGGAKTTQAAPAVTPESVGAPTIEAPHADRARRLSWPSRERVRFVARTIGLAGAAVMGYLIYRGRVSGPNLAPDPTSNVAPPAPSSVKVAPPAPSASSSAKPVAPRRFCGKVSTALAKPDARCPLASPFAWCDADDSLLICCAEGLVPSEDGAICGCPPGGSDKKHAALGCPPVKPDALTTPLIQKTVKAKERLVRGCYEDALRRHAGRVGTVEARFFIDPYGRVFDARIRGASLPDAEMQRCIVSFFASLEFAPPPDGQVLSVDYPYAFSPPSARDPPSNARDDDDEEDNGEPPPPPPTPPRTE